MLKTKRTIIFGLLLFLAVSLKAQQSRVTAAYTFLQQGKLDSAKATIDVAVLHPETQSDGQAWYVRGFIYKEIFKSYLNNTFNVTYSAENGGTAQNSNVPVGWSHTFYVKKGASLGLSSQVQKGSVVTVVIFINDKIYKQLTSSGDHVIASVSGVAENDGTVKYAVYGSEINSRANPIYNKSSNDSRIEALISFKKSLTIDTAQENVAENIKNIKYLATTLYNDAAASLDTIDYKIAVNNFDAFREYYLLVDPSKENFKQKEIDFANAMATVYTRIYEADRNGKTDFLNYAKASYNKALSFDPNNINANYNMGILYYNQAVNLINQSDYDLDIVALNDVQDNSINLFKQSLPFMEKAYSLDPNKKETLLGLSGIYFSLNEKEKSNEFKQKLEQIGK